MKNKIRILMLMIISLLLGACSQQSSVETSQTPDSTTKTVESLSDLSDLFSDRDYESDYDESTSVKITIKDDAVECASDSVTISNSNITITEEGTYVINGTLTNGMIIVNASDSAKIQLVLAGVNINSESSAAIYIAQADKVFISLKDGTSNTLSNGGSFVAIDDNNIDAAIFSKADLTLNGSGSLVVSSPAGHGIVSKDDLVITGGEYDITALNQGISGKDLIGIADGSFTITSRKDGIHAENQDDSSLGYIYIANGTYAIKADGDGISSSNSIQIDGGSFVIESGGGSSTVNLDANGNWGWNRPGTLQSEAEDTSASAKGIKATSDLLLNAGMFTIDSADDGLHSNANLTVNGGSLTISSGDDGLHADELLTINDGTITIAKSYEGIEGLNIEINGGSVDLIATDDGLNAAGGNDQSGNGGFGGFEKGGFESAGDSSISIAGGTVCIDASGDGIDSNGSLSITGGTIYVYGPTNDGNGTLDYSGEAVISGGVFMATGTSGMALNFSDSSSQGAMMVSITGSANDLIILSTEVGEELLKFPAKKAFSNIIISSPSIETGQTYTLKVGTSEMEITMDSIIYGSNGFNERPGGGNMGNMPNDRGEMGPRPQAK